MNLQQLGYFRAVCQHRSISAAANHLHISQPSLSTAIKELEAEFGVTLFVRHHRGVTLTAEGETLYTMARDILGRTEQAAHVMKTLGNERKRLRLGVPPMIGSLLLSRIYKEFVPSHPDIRIDITEGGYDELTSKLNEDYLDMIFISHDDGPDASFSSIPLGKPEMVCCVHKAHPVAALSCIEPQDLKDVPLVLFEDSFYQTLKIKEWFCNAAVEPHVLMQTEQLSTLTSMISHNLAVGFMFRALADTVDCAVCIPMQQPMAVNISLVWKANTHRFEAMQTFLQYSKGCRLF